MTPEFTWKHYLLGNNIIAGVIQTFTLIGFASVGFGLLCAALT